MAAIVSLSGYLLVSSLHPVLAQDFVTPGPNSNIVGLTPDPDDIPDFGLKQQQEPACIVRPGNESAILCAFNDLRASDVAAVQGDAWIGVTASNDAGETWFSRLAPGFKSHPNSIGQDFAADPGLVAIPGNSPGLAILSYIAGFRDSTDSVLVIQRWIEYPQEDRDFWKAENQVRIVADSFADGGFIDKPAIFYLVDDPASQGEITQSIGVEDEPAPISITTPTGTLALVYTVFPAGGGGSKVLLRRSFDNGETWTNATVLADGPTQVTGASVAALGNKLAVVYRRSAGEVSSSDNDDDSDSDGNSSVEDAIMVRTCTLSGTGINCKKAKVLFETCPFDQPASEATFRTFTFPWIASDGMRFWVFAADRRFAGDSSCTPVPGAPGQFSGKPRIVGMSSVNGQRWVGAAGNKNEPFVVAPSAEGFQVMPTALGTKGRIELAWYDTRREEQQGLPPGNNDLLINDYSNGPQRVFRKADIYMTRLSATCSTNPRDACTPTIENPVRVTQFPFVLETLDAQEAVGQEVEALLTNLRLYASGTRAFNGDYVALATPAFRRLANGKWIPNSLPEGMAGPEQPGYTNRQDVFIAWGDSRDVEADFTGPNSTTQLPYSPPSNSPAAAMMREIDPNRGTADERYAAGEPDDDPVLPSDLAVCAPGASSDFSKSRDSNVYGALLRDEPSLVARTPTKPLNTIQRMYPLEVTNIDAENPQTYCLQIANQPSDFPTTGLASFFQLPAIAPFASGDEVELLDVDVPAGSSASRAAFVTTGNPATVIDVNAYEGACPPTQAGPFGALISSVSLGDGLLFDPAVCDGVACDPVNAGVNSNETHELSLAGPVLQAPVLQAPSFQAPGLQAPGLQAPVLQAPGFQAPGFQAPGLQAPVLQAPGFQAPGFQAPVLQAPGLQAPSLQAGTPIGDAQQTDIVYQDVTFVLSTDGNVSTTVSADIAVASLGAPGESIVQLIAWTPNIYATSADCLAVPTADQQIIAYRELDAPSLQAVTLPFAFTKNNQNPYAGEVSYTAAPAQDVALTVRIWATGSAKTTLETLQQEFDACGGDPVCEDTAGTQKLIAFGASSQACNTDDAESNTQSANLPDCLDNGDEKIFQDKLPPVLTLPVSFDQEATGPGGAVVNFVVDASDNADPAPVVTCVPASGSTLPLGLNTISCMAEDASGNISNASFEITVVDTTAPVIPPISPVTAEATSASGAVVNYGDVFASDAVDVSVAAVCTPASGSVFGLGTTTVDCVATDSSGNASATASFDVTVEDTTPPTLNLPANVTVLARDASDVDVVYALGGGAVTVEANLPNDAAAARVEYAPTADDVVDGAPTASCVPASGSTFPIGTTIVSCTASDANGNTSASQSFSITVEDTTDPVFNVADNTAFGFDANQAGGANVDLPGNPPVIFATDRGAVIVPTCEAQVGNASITLPAVLPPGDYSVVCSVPGVSNVVTVTVIADVDDNVPPVLTIPAAMLTADADPLTGTAVIDFLAPGAFPGGASITATDIVDSDVTISCVPPSGSAFNVGSTTVVCTASDDGPNASGQPNTVSDSFTIIVSDVTPPVITVFEDPLRRTISNDDDSDSDSDAVRKVSIDYLANVSADDAVDGNVVPVCTVDGVSQPNPYDFPAGTALVACTATDASGNQSAAQFDVIVTVAPK